MNGADPKAEAYEEYGDRWVYGEQSKHDNATYIPAPNGLSCLIFINLTQNSNMPTYLSASAKICRICPSIHNMYTYIAQGVDTELQFTPFRPPHPIGSCWGGGSYLKESHYAQLLMRRCFDRPPPPSSDRVELSESS